MSYQDKYLKYKNKYLALKNQLDIIEQRAGARDQSESQPKLFNMIFIGPPGGGKGTEIQLLQQMGYYKVSTGDLLRDEVSKGTELGKEIKKDMDAGNLINDSIVTELLNEKIKERNYGLIFDGYPTLN